MKEIKAILFVLIMCCCSISSKPLPCMDLHDDKSTTQVSDSLADVIFKSVYNAYFNTEGYPEEHNCYPQQFYVVSISDSGIPKNVYVVTAYHHFLPFSLTTVDGLIVSNIDSNPTLDSLLEFYPNYGNKNYTSDYLEIVLPEGLIGSVSGFIGGDYFADLDPCLSVTITEPDDNQTDFVLKKPFPNPTNGIVNIPIQTLKGENVEGKLFSYELYDLFGQRVARGQLILQGNSLQVDLCKQPDGTYLLKVYCRENQSLIISTVLKKQ